MLVVVSSGLTVLGPYLLGLAIDRYIDRGDLPGLARLLLLMLAIFVLTSLLLWLQSYVMAGAAQRTVRDIRNDLFGRLQALPLRFFDRRPHGDLMSRLTNDVENINQVLTDSVAQLVSGVLTAVGVAVVMFVDQPVAGRDQPGEHPGMTLVLNRWIAPRTRTGFRRQQAALGTLNGLIEETITGQRVVKAYHREAVVIEQFDTTNQRAAPGRDTGADLRRLHRSADERDQQPGSGDRGRARAAGWPCRVWRPSARSPASSATRASSADR